VPVSTVGAGNCIKHDNDCFAANEGDNEAMNPNDSNVGDV